MNKSKYLALYVLVLSMLVMGVGGFYATKAWSLKNDTLDVGVAGKNNMYTVRKNATPLQTNLYKTLIEELSQDPRNDGKIAESVAVNFIADYYTWTNKVRMNDVGGLQYIHPQMRTSVYDQSLDRFYNDMRFVMEAGDLKDSLEVDAVKATNQLISFNVDEKPEQAFLVHVDWTYKPTAFDTKRIQNKADVTVIKDNTGRYSIVEVDDGSLKSEQTEED